MEYLLKASGIVTILFISYYLFLRKETFFKSIRVYFLIGMALTLIIPLIKIPVNSEILNPLNNFNTAENSETALLSLENILAILPYLYWSGVAVFTGLFIIQMFSLSRLLENNVVRKEGKVFFVEIDKDISPFSFFNFVVYNKNNFSEEELKNILTHEKAHVNQLHSVDTMLTQFMQIILWFNPFVWLFKKAVDQNLEFLADSDAVDRVNCNRSFQLTLLKTTQVDFCNAVTNNFYNKLIKRRIEFLNSKRSAPLSQLKYLVIVPFLAVFIYLFNITTISAEENISGEHFEERSNEHTNTMIGKESEEHINNNKENREEHYLKENQNSEHSSSDKEHN